MKHVGRTLGKFATGAQLARKRLNRQCAAARIEPVCVQQWPSGVRSIRSVGQLSVETVVKDAVAQFECADVAERRRGHYFDRPQ